MKKVVILLSCLLSIVFCCGDGLTYSIADSFRFPLDNYNVGANYFGKFDLVRDNEWHTGEDTTAKADTPVYVPGNGIIKEAQVHNGYGGMYIIEHTLPDGQQICSIIPHADIKSFAKKAGQEVVKGEYLCQIGTSAENGGWSEHFHYAIRKGPYPRNPNEYKCGNWIFSGYTACKEVLDDWYNPTIFIKNIGRYSDGFHTDGTSQAFADCREEFKDKIGHPFDNGGGVYVHLVGSVWAQDYKQPDMSKPHFGTDGESCIILNEEKDKSYLVREGFWGKYKEVWGFDNLRAPNGNEFTYTSDSINITRQEFQKGYMEWQQGKPVDVHFGEYASKQGVQVALIGGESSDDTASSGSNSFNPIEPWYWVDPPINPMCATMQKGEMYWYCGMSALSDAISEMQDGDTLVLHPGEYFGGISFGGKAITIKSEDPNNPNIVAITSVSSVSFTNNEGRNSILKGITVANPHHSGTGIVCEGASPTISKCVISGHTENLSGGGMRITNGSSPLITNCVIENNSSRYNEGGGIFILESSPEIVGCTIRNNHTTGYGGGIYVCYSRNFTIEKCVITGNSSSQNHGGGIGFGAACFVNLKNCVIAKNTAKFSGGGIFLINSGDIGILNCTVADNTATEQGGGIYGNAHSVRILNSIFWNDTPDDIYLNGDGLSVSHCDYKTMPFLTPNDGKLSWDPSRNLLFDNIDVDPLFTNSANGDYSLSSSSPCIGRGTTRDDVQDDLLGNARPDGIRYDIGAYEFQGEMTLLYGFQKMGEIFPGESIQGMIDLAPEDEPTTITVHSGTYAENIDLMGKPIHLKSANPYDLETVRNTVLTKYWSTAPIVKFRYGLNASNSSLSGFTIENGEAEYGAGIYIESCAPAISNCIIRNNHATSAGGGIYCGGWIKTTRIQNCVIEDNSAKWAGAGIFCRGGDSNLEISECVFLSNSASSGSAIYVTYDARPQVRNSAFWDNARPFISRDYSNGNPMVLLYDCFLQNDYTYNYAGNYESNSYIYEPPEVNVIEKPAQALYINLVYPYNNAYVTFPLDDKIIDWDSNGDTFYICISRDRNNLQRGSTCAGATELPLWQFVSARNKLYFYKIIAVRGVEKVSSPIYEFRTGN